MSYTIFSFCLERSLAEFIKQTALLGNYAILVEIIVHVPVQQILRVSLSLVP